MQTPENQVWQRFRKANERVMRRLYFNVHCGTVPGLTAGASELENRTRSALWSKRVDVIAETASEVWLIEVKAAVRPSAIGQTLVYVPLIGARKLEWSNPRPMLIGDYFDPDSLALCGTMGLECFGPEFHLIAPKRPAAA